jgi:hypothetical protein
MSLKPFNQPNTNAKTGLPWGVIAGRNLHPEVQSELHLLAASLSSTQVLADWKVKAVKEMTTALEVFGRVTQEQKDQIAEIVEAAGDNSTEQFTDPEPSASVVYQGYRAYVTYLGGAMLVFSEDGPVVGGRQLCSPCVPNAVDLDAGFDAAGTPGSIDCHGFPADWYPDNEEA